MTSEKAHELAIRNVGFSNRFLGYDPFSPLTVDEFKSLSQSEDLAGLSDSVLEKMWIVPIQRMLQEHFRIDQRNYSDTTDPTLAELQEDFKVATVIAIDKFARNDGELVGQHTAEGATVNWSQKMPPRVNYLLERYERKGGRVGRA